MKLTIKPVLTLMTASFLFLCAVIIIAPVIGTLWVFAGLKWGIFSILLILMVASAATYMLRKVTFFHFESLTELAIFAALTLLVLFIYLQVSPVLSIQQDQSLYIMRSFNLINYGTLEKPMETFIQLTESGLINADQSLYNYGSLANGNQISNGFLVPDFYAGGSFFFALCGFFVRKYAFYGQTLIMLACSGLLYFTLKNILESKDTLVAWMYTATFVMAPVIIWFGRSSSTEPMALLIWLAILSLLLAKDVPIGILMGVFVGALLARIDYFIVSLLGVFIVTYMNHRWGLLLTVLSGGFAYICTQTYWIYYNRISTNDFKIIQYQIALMVAAWVIGWVASKYLKDIVEKIYFSRFLKWFLFVFGMIVLLMVFRKLTPVEFRGRFTEFGLDILSNEEFILDNLFTVFPSVVIALGLVSGFKFLKNKRINIMAGFFFIPMFMVSCYFVYKSGNAPQMYFLFRRYFNVFLPSVLLLFALFMDSKDRSKRLIIAGVVMVLSGNQYMVSRQHVEYAGLNDAVETFVQTFPETVEGSMFYDSKDKTDLSPLLSYTTYDMVPIQSEEELSNVSEHQEMYTIANSYYLTVEPIDALEAYQVMDLSYYRMGESLTEVPRNYSQIEVKVYVYWFEDVAEAVISGSDNIFRQ